MDIYEEKRKAKVEIRRNFKIFLWFFVVDVITVFGGSFLYIYIEHCYDVRPPVKTRSQTKLETLCRKLQIANVTFEQFLDNETASVIQDLCFNVSDELTKVECAFDAKNFFKWTRFATSVGFTTGYGRFVPLSDAGKITTIFYALTLIPMIAAAMIYCSKFLVAVVKSVVLVIENRVLGRQKILHFNRKTMLLQTFLLLLVFNAFVFYSRNRIVDSNNIPTDSYVDAYYFGLITMTTIGFGDYDYGDGVYDDLDRSAGQTILYQLNAVIFLILMAMGASFINALTTLQTSQPLRKISKKKSMKKSVDNQAFDTDG